MTMYESMTRESVWKDPRKRHAAVTYHRGGPNDLLKKHQEDARLTMQQGIRGAWALAPYLFDRVADARTFHAAWNHLSANGGQTPGPDGRRYTDYDTEEVWGLCRRLEDELQRGTYEPGPERVRHIPKASGPGERPLVLQSIRDRVVQRAIVEILQPVLDPLLDKHTFGFRPHLGYLHALARAQSLAQEQGRYVWVAEDLKDAFTRVPLPRLDDLLCKLLPDDGLLDLLRRVLPSQNVKGLRQGGSLSPLMLNVYVNQLLDRPWRRRQGPVPLLRVADDLLLLCQDAAEAGCAQQTLRALLTPAGMLLKGDPADTARDLEKGEAADWLGCRLRLEQTLRFEITDRAWARLDDLLKRANTKVDAPLLAARTARQWLQQRGPCYPWSDRDEVGVRIVETARKYAFEEVPSPTALCREWKRAYFRWRALRRQVLQDVLAEQENGFFPRL
jgi:hypothetical protein